jgi:hypothetical protein
MARGPSGRKRTCPLCGAVVKRIGKHIHAQHFHGRADGKRRHCWCGTLLASHGVSKHMSVHGGVVPHFLAWHLNLK